MTIYFIKINTGRTVEFVYSTKKYKFPSNFVFTEGKYKGMRIIGTGSSFVTTSTMWNIVAKR